MNEIPKPNPICGANHTLYKDLCHISEIFMLPPFPYTLDPNAPMALNPEQYGIKKLYKNFEDYYKATSSLKWIDWVAHETKNMSKKKIAEVTEKIYRAINEIYEAGLFRENVEHRYRLDHEL
ncbi:MAG: hypothetical protein QXY91_06600 [Thermoproteota archaeon]